MTPDNTIAPPLNWAALQYEWAMAHSVASDELRAYGAPQPATIERMRLVMARAEAELAIILARLP